MNPSRGGGAALVALIVVGLVLVSSRKASAAIVDTTGDYTRRGSAKEWALTRYAVALDAVRSHWGGAVDDAVARAIALSMLTHWAIETGDGAGEVNWNVGNINASGGRYVLVKDIDGTWHKQVAYDSLEDGINAYVGLLGSPRYAVAAKKLADDPKSSAWFLALGHAGWFDPTTAKPPVTWEAAGKTYDGKRASLAKTVGV